MDSDDYTSEDSKKRNRVDDGELFIKSKKTMRTPAKGSQTEVKLDQILSLMHNLTRDTQQLTTEVRDIKNEQMEYRKEIGELRKEIEEIKLENLKIRNEKCKIEKELSETKDRMEKLEKESKINNIVLQGLQIENDDSAALRDVMTNFIKKEMNIEVKVDDAIKLGYKTCLVKLKDKQDKNLVMKNKHKLRHIKGKQVYINNDLTKEELLIQKTIRLVAKEEKKNGKEIKFRHNKLIIDGKVWKWNKDQNQLVEIELVNSKNG